MKKKNKKILCFSDSFNSGGAQKQLMMLANGLIERNYDVATMQYHKLNFFSNDLNQKVLRFDETSRNKLLRVFKILYKLFIYNPDCIISFLHGPNNYAAIYKVFFFWRKIKLITGERNLDIKPFDIKAILIRIPHIFANKIVCNSNAQKTKINFYFRKKVLFIPNGTSVNNLIVKENYMSEPKKIKLIVPARFTLQKNPINLLIALSIIKSKKNLDIKLYWFGEIDYTENIYLQSKKYINENKLENNFIFKEPVLDIFVEMIKLDAVILPSFYEGCPNAIIDGMLCGMPVLASNVSDNEIYLKHQSEFLFDPNNPCDIADKIEAFSQMNGLDRKQLGRENSMLAKKYFDINKMVNSYICLIE